MRAGPVSSVIWNQTQCPANTHISLVPRPRFVNLILDLNPPLRLEFINLCLRTTIDLHDLSFDTKLFFQLLALFDIDFSRLVKVWSLADEPER